MTKATGKCMYSDTDTFVYEFNCATGWCEVTRLSDSDTW